MASKTKTKPTMISPGGRSFEVSLEEVKILENLGWTHPVKPEVPPKL